MSARFLDKSVCKRSIRTIFLATAAVAIVAAFPARAEGDAERGATVFKKCMACHEIGPDAKNKVGPVLTGVVGRPAGSIEGFKYGSGMLAAAEMGLVWDEDKVSDYISDPRKYLRSFTGNQKAKAKMTFKLKKEADRLDVIAYLKTVE